MVGGGVGVGIVVILAENKVTQHSLFDAWAEVWQYLPPVMVESKGCSTVCESPEN